MLYLQRRPYSQIFRLCCSLLIQFCVPVSKDKETYRKKKQRAHSSNKAIAEPETGEQQHYLPFLLN